MAKRKKSHGGKRPGAGRPAGESKRVIAPRITLSAYSKLGDNPTARAAEVLEAWAGKQK